MSSGALHFEKVEIDKTIEEQIIDLLYQPGGYKTLGTLIDIDPKTLSASGRIDYLAALEKQHSWLTSLIQDATLAIAGATPNESDQIWDGVDESEREDVATALRLSPSTAQMRIDVARTLSNHLPATCDALSTGVISASHATLIARETADALKRGVSPDILCTIEDKAIAFSEFHTPAQVGRKLRTLFAKYSPAEFEAAHEIARDTRSVRLFPEGDGMSTLIALLPAEEAQTVYLAINAMVEYQEKSQNSASTFSSSPTSPHTASSHTAYAHTDSYASSHSPLHTDSYPSSHSPLHVSSSNAASHNSDSSSNSSSAKFDPNTSSAASAEKMEMRRADALAAIAADFLGRISDNYTPHRRPVSINLTIDLPTMLGLAENPAQLSGYGPIPASIARNLAADGKWRKFITDPETGNLLDCGRESYIPSQPLVDFLTARDRICRFPGCSQPARLGDIDHAQSWESGGLTNVANLGFLCRRHHRLKTHGGWKLESHADGSCTWTSPNSQTYFVPARPINEAV
jgi:hypothetical protein